MKNLLALGLYLIAQLLVFRLICVEYAQYKLHQFNLQAGKSGDSGAASQGSCSHDHAALSEQYDVARAKNEQIFRKIEEFNLTRLQVLGL